MLAISNTSSPNVTTSIFFSLTYVTLSPYWCLTEIWIQKLVSSSYKAGVDILTYTGKPHWSRWEIAPLPPRCSAQVWLEQCGDDRGWCGIDAWIWGEVGAAAGGRPRAPSFQTMLAHYLHQLSERHGSRWHAIRPNCSTINFIPERIVSGDAYTAGI